MAPVNATHLLFAIWAMTQSYADFSAQMALVLNRKQLTRKDFDDAEKVIVDMVLAAISVPQPPAAARPEADQAQAGQQHGVGFRLRHRAHVAAQVGGLEEVVGVDLHLRAHESTTTLPLMTPWPPLTDAFGARMLTLAPVLM
jgi:hypothetical protein